MDFDIEKYILQFNILDDKNISLLYNFLINRFNDTCHEKDYQDFNNFQINFNEFMENLRDLDIKYTINILNYLNSKNIYLTDIIIMSWCLPNHNILSKTIYRKKYINMIKNYNSKLVSFVDNEIITNFCCNMLSRNLYLPLFCIDILWYYMQSFTLEFSFHNMETAEYMKINFIADKNIEIGLNLEFLLQTSLGRITFLHNPFCFVDVIKEILTNIKTVRNFMKCPSKHNFIKQIINIYKNQSVYNIDLGEMSSEIKKIIEINILKIY